MQITVEQKDRHRANHAIVCQVLFHWNILEAHRRAIPPRAVAGFQRQEQLTSTYRVSIDGIKEGPWTFQEKGLEQVRTDN